MPRVRKTPAMTLVQVRGFLTALSTAYPDAASELDYTDPFTLLVAVVLSAQTTDVAVNRVGKTLFAAAPDPAAMVALGPRASPRISAASGCGRRRPRTPPRCRRC